MNITTRKVYEFIVQQIACEGIPPNLREIAAAVDIASTSTASYHVRLLRDAGLLKIKAGEKVARGIVVTGAVWTPPKVVWLEVIEDYPIDRDRPRGQLSDMQVQEMRELRQGRALLRELADRFNVDESTVSLVVRGLRRVEAGGPIDAG